MSAFWSQEPAGIDGIYAGAEQFEGQINIFRISAPDFFLDMKSLYFLYKHNPATVFSSRSQPWATDPLALQSPSQQHGTPEDGMICVRA